MNNRNEFVAIEILQNMEIELSNGILSLLGLKHGKLKAGSHTGEKKINFAKPKELRIYLDQINTTANYVDETPGTLLGIMPVLVSLLGM